MTIKNYNAFVRNARKEYGLTLGEACTMYNIMKERVGRSLFAVDIVRYPRISKAAAQSAVQSVKQQRVLAALSGAEKGRRYRLADEVIIDFGSAGGSGVIDSLKDFYDYYSEDIDYDYDEWESSADYTE